MPAAEPVIWGRAVAAAARGQAARGGAAAPHCPAATPARAGACAAAALGAAAAKRRGRAGTRCARRALAEDVAVATDEALNTLEDAAMHMSRLAPWLTQSAEERAIRATPSLTGKRRIVVLGTGWAAHAIAKVVDANENDVCMVSPRNYFVFTPMLAAASVGTVEYRSILEHIRSANPTVRFYQGACEAVDVVGHTITVRPTASESGEAFAMAYDVLVVAVGTRPSGVGTPGVDEHCYFLKDITDAQSIRRRVTECFERADLPTTTEEEQRRLLTFAVVGGGPTGCEFCGELSDFVRNDLRKFYPKLAKLVHILLLHRGKVVLPSFGDSLQDIARQTLEGQGIEVVTSAELSKAEADSITVLHKGGSSPKEEVIPCGLCVWVAAQGGQDMVKALIQQLPRQRELSNSEARGDTSRLFVDDWLRLEGVADGSVIALGDCARTVGPPLAQTAQVAAQQGAFVSRLLNRGYTLAADGPPQLDSTSELLRVARARGQTTARPFRFFDLGMLAYLGESQAVAEVGFGSTQVTRAAGQAAFLLWRSVYVVKQVSFRNRVLVLFDWVKSRVFGRDLTRF